MITLVLADDHRVVRQGLRALLAAEPDLTVVGEAGDGLEALRLVEGTKPRVLVVDLTMPGLNGLEVTREVRRRSPETRVVVLSVHRNFAHVVAALKNGATAYVLKDAGRAELLRAVHEASAGRRYLSPPLSEAALEAYLERTRSATLDPYETLTAREREVLQLVAEGQTSPRIAARLSISPRTAETHRANVARKLGLRTHADLIRYAIERGITPGPSRPP